MIWKCIFIISSLIVIEFFRVWLKCLTDDDYDTNYNYCDDCKYGFCMEYPKTEDCKRWQEEQDVRK